MIGIKSVRRLLPGNTYNVSDHFLQTLVLSGYWPENNIRILDFGCGQGNLVREFRQLGFDAFGFDINNYVKDEDIDVKKYLYFGNSESDDTSSHIFERSGYMIPFEDNYFDLVVSTSVFEHVMDIEPVIKEIARVIKDDGVSIHVYPHSNIFIEPHMYVPLASRFQSWYYFYFWALLGIRNEYQKDLNAREVAHNNVRYCKTGLKYYKNKELKAAGGRYFEHVKTVSKQYRYNNSHRDTFQWLDTMLNLLAFIARRVITLFSKNPLQTLSKLQPLNAIIMANKLKQNNIRKHVKSG